MPKAIAITEADGTVVGHEIYCPGCKHSMFFPWPRWGFNGDFEKPTFTPSMIETLGPFPEGTKLAGKVTVCHVIVKDGIANFCNDSTHKLAGKSVPLEDYSRPTLI